MWYGFVFSVMSVNLCFCDLLNLSKVNNATTACGNHCSAVIADTVSHTEIVMIFLLALSPAPFVLNLRTTRTQKCNSDLSFWMQAETVVHSEVQRGGIRRKVGDRVRLHSVGQQPRQICAGYIGAVRSVSVWAMLWLLRLRAKIGNGETTPLLLIDHRLRPSPEWSLRTVPDWRDSVTTRGVSGPVVSPCRSVDE